MWTNTQRFADVIGSGHNAVNKASWHYTSTSPFCFSAALHGQLGAAAWAIHIHDDSGNDGCNLAYGLLNHVEGRGLAKLLAGFAVRPHIVEVPDIGFVNVQTRASNERSATLAKSLGMRVVPEKGFDVVRPGRNAVISHCTYRVGAQTVASSAKLAIAKRLHSAGCDLDVTGSAWNQTEII